MKINTEPQQEQNLLTDRQLSRATELLTRTLFKRCESGLCLLCLLVFGSGPPVGAD